MRLLLWLNKHTSIFIIAQYLFFLYLGLIIVSAMPLSSVLPKKNKHKCGQNDIHVYSEAPTSEPRSLKSQYQFQSTSVDPERNPEIMA